MKLLRHTLLAGSLMALMLSGLTLPLATSASDSDDLSDAHALGPYDEVSCNGASEDELDTGDPNEDYFPPFEFDTSEQSDDGGGSFSGQYSFPFSDEEVFQQFNRDSERASEPRVNVTVAPTEVEPGQEVSIVASLADFRDNAGNQNLAYAVAFAVNEISLQGILAGGKKLPESPTGSACGLVTRTAASDQDRDGMDDNWESAYGLNPDDASDAFADPDGDSASKFYLNAEGETLTVTPETAGGPTGVMNNLAEFVYDTDPRRADTDGDNITDGMEIIGFGGSAVTFKVDQPIGSALTVRAFAVGVSTQQDAKKELANIIKLDSTLKTFFVSNGEHLRGQVKTQDKFAVPGSSVTVEASFVGSEAEPDSFAYTYVVDGQEVQNPSSARHLLEVQVDPERQPGQDIPYEIRAVNPATGQLATLRGVIHVGEAVTLQADPPAPPAGSPYTVHALLNSNTSTDDYLFEWTIDGVLDERASGVGRATIGLTAEASTGSTQEVALKLYSTDQSVQVGQATLAINVARPAVAIELVPDSPSEGDTVTAFARPADFPFNLDSDNDGSLDATLLRYDWSVDGTSLQPIESAAGFSSITFLAGSDGQEHSLNLSVRSLGERAESAQASKSFVTGAGGSGLAYNFRKTAGSLTASLIKNASQIAGVVTATLIVAGLLGYITVQRRRSA
ncbi:MAG: hypothetical protein V1895_00690 [Parcubacteria group bacterium]